MGVTSTDVKLIEKVLALNPNIKSVIELGSQNLYIGNEKDPPFASEWYKSKGLEYKCIDLGGDNQAYQLDLSNPLPDNFLTFQSGDFVYSRVSDIVTDFGTSEHVVQMEKHTKVAFHDGHINSIYPDGVKNAPLGLYNCWLNKHNLLAEGGYMINVNPKTGHWPGHGYHYYTIDFYKKLAELCGYEIILLEEQAAMGNYESGMNIVCILRKINNFKFISFETFQLCDIKTS